MKLPWTRRKEVTAEREAAEERSRKADEEVRRPLQQMRHDNHFTEALILLIREQQRRAGT